MSTDAAPVALVVGGGRGIGAAIADRLAAQGYHVEIAARSEAETRARAGDIRERGFQAHAIRCDVTKQEDIELLREAVGARHGRLDLLVCAAGWAKLGGVHSVTSAEFATMVNLHLVAPYALVRAFADLIEQSGATVVVIGSRAGNVASPGAFAYGASKAAVTFLVQGLARDLAGVRVLGVNPGAVDTRLRKEAVGQERAETSLATPESIAEVVWGLIAIRNPRLTGAVVDVPW